MAEKTRLLELTRMKYVDQAKWFLNGFWKDGAEQEAENVWKFTNKFTELDEKYKKEGCELDEFQAHKFLESLGETLTVIQLRDKLRKIDVDANGKMALLEYLAFKYAKSIKQIVDAPQGSNKEELDEAEAKLKAVTDAFADLQSQLAQQQTALEEQKKAAEEQKRTAEEARVALESQRKALEEQKRSAEQARQALESQQAAEEAVRKAEAEQRAAVEELTKQEESYKNSINTLEAKSKDPSSSTVAKNKAANELAQLKQEDPLPLRKAKITQEATLRKVEKERKAAEAATAKAADANAKAENAAAEAEARTQKAEEAKAQADAAALDAEAKAAALEEQTRKVEEAVRETEDKVKEAQDYLESVKAKGGVAYGAIWWMERELKEAQKYLPKKKQQQ